MQLPKGLKTHLQAYVLYLVSQKRDTTGSIQSALRVVGHEVTSASVNSTLNGLVGHKFLRQKSIKLAMERRRGQVVAYAYSITKKGEEALQEVQAFYEALSSSQRV